MQQPTEKQINLKLEVIIELKKHQRTRTIQISLINVISIINIFQLITH